ncbi:hypothetical protein ACQ4PT_063165 [Festuca glaucescens]
MVDPVGSVKQVVKLALVIKEAADTVRHNKGACDKLRELVDILHAVVAPLENMDMASWTPGMIAALRSLEAALRRGHDLVTACQKKRNIICSLFTAGRQSKRLLRVKDDISTQILIANFAVNVNASVLLVTIAHHRHAQCSLHPPPLQVRPSHQCIYSLQSKLIDSILSIYGYLRIFRPSQLEAATNNFSVENVIGKSDSAIIYKGALPNELIVSIKRYPDQLGTQSIKKYVHVFHLLLEHENVVKFLGFCHVKGSEMVVEEYMPNGSLFEIINGSSRKMNWLSTFRVMQGVAQGLAYLHSKDIIHLDLNPANIVFDSNMNPKISNFERSKLPDKNIAEEMRHDLVGTMGYMAPEYIMNGSISMASDVFALGVLLLHCISGLRSSILDQHPIIWAWEVRQAHSMNGLRDSSWCGEHQLEEIRRCMEIGLLCTQEFPEDRPTMPDVLKFLNGNEILPTPKKPCFI